MNSLRRIHLQRGFSLLEGLISIVIFSLAMLGLVGLQASSVQMTTEAKYRADAAFLADQLIGQLSVSNPTNLLTFAHQPGGNPCNPNGAASGNAVVTGWLAQVNQVLPGADGTKQQIIVNNDGRVEINLCWQSPQQAARTHTVTTMMQWQ